MSAHLNHSGGKNLLRDIRDGYDGSARQSFNTVFGDKIIATRVAHIEEQFQYNINTKTLTTNVNSTSGTVTQADNMAIVATGTDTDGEATLESKKVIRYVPGYEGYANFTALFENGGVATSIQHIGPFTSEDGYFVGYTNTDFVVGRKLGGTRTEVTEANFNGSSEFSRIDKTKLNIFRITWGWLGTATITFECKLPEKWIVVHQMLLENSLTQPHSSNPVLPMCCTVVKTAGATDIILKTASWGCGLAGMDTHAGDRFFTGSIAKTVTTEAVMINFQNQTTFQSKTNRVVAEGVKLSMSSDGNKQAIIKIYKNLTITSPTWADVDSTNSVLQTDTAGTVTPSDANLLMQYNLARQDSIIDDIAELDFEIDPGDTVTITGQSPSSSDLTFTARWREEF